MKTSFKLTVLSRMFHKGFSKGEKKKLELSLQLEPKVQRAEAVGAGNIQLDFPCQDFTAYTSLKVVCF